MKVPYDIGDLTRDPDLENHIALPSPKALFLVVEDRVLQLGSCGPKPSALESREPGPQLFKRAKDLRRFRASGLGLMV